MHNIPEYGVSEFARSIKRIIEDSFGYVRIKGEISGFKQAASGHLYFNLKDQSAIINAVCFRQMASLIAFDIEDGLEVVASGKVTIYEGRSNYQIIVEKLEIAGIGAILAAIEERRKRLLAAGFFDEKHKKPLPFLPRNIAVITSPKGAVIEDIKNRIKDRFPTSLTIYPIAVQGKEAASQAIKAIEYFNSQDQEKVDLIIIARGGGSFEDLLPFNDEDLVKAVFASKIPIISAIGHETDTSLIDYAADVRAPTPTAAAEMAVPVLKDLQNLLENLDKRLSNYFNNLLSNKENDLKSLASNLKHPREKLADLTQKTNQLSIMLKSNLAHNLKAKMQDLRLLENKMPNLQNRYDIWQNKLNFLHNNLQLAVKNLFKNNQEKLLFFDKMLISYDYKNVLKRGYAVVRGGSKIINSKTKIKNSQLLNIEVADGDFEAMVVGKQKTLPKKKDDDIVPSLF